MDKTTLANKLPPNRWFHYSGDYRIRTKYLEEPILDNIKRQAMKIDFLRDLLRSDSIYIASNITVNNLDPISTFLGKIGRSDAGGLSLAEFKRRQHLHMLAEAQAMKDVADFIVKAHEIYGYRHFVNDTAGSVCEPPEVIYLLAAHTLALALSRLGRCGEVLQVAQVVQSRIPTDEISVANVEEAVGACGATLDDAGSPSPAPDDSTLQPIATEAPATAPTP